MKALDAPAGADYILTYDGALPMDYYQAAFDEANKAGIPVFTRAYGPVLFPKDAALLGAANLPHSAGIGIAVTKDPSKAARPDTGACGTPCGSGPYFHDQFSRISKGMGSIHCGSPAVFHQSGPSCLLSPKCGAVRFAKLQPNRPGRVARAPHERFRERHALPQECLWTREEHLGGFPATPTMHGKPGIDLHQEMQ